MVRFIDDDHVPATGRQFPKRTFAAFHEVDRGNNSRLDAPGISAGFQRAARFGDALAVEDTKFKPKLCRELGLPLFSDGSWADDEDSSSSTASVQLAQDQPCFDGLAETDVVGNEQPRARKFQRAQCGDLLVPLKIDLGTRRRNEAIITRRKAEPDCVHQ